MFIKLNTVKIHITLALCCVFAITANAQDNTHAIGARAAGMGNAGVATVDIWSTVNNQAALTLLSSTEISAFYKNNFGISELSLSALSVAVPVKTGVLGGSVAHFGFSEYSETKISLAYAKRLWKMFSLSVQINYNSLNFTNAYQNTTAVSGEVGLFARLADNLYAGAHVFNPTKSSLSLETKERLPVRYKTGIMYKPISSLLFCADFVYDSGNSISFCGGTEYYILSQLCLRAGVSTNPELFTVGAGYIYKRINFDVAFNYHNVLGYTSCISISYKLNKK
ncbi:MAG: hypothetical protein LBP85_03145 [Prevotellaceae bacterium]|jgi:long-subunit fatty acid transport protein|nr:hypothetical protein [Prevotellaceae bacterium]